MFITQTVLYTSVMNLFYTSSNYIFNNFLECVIEE